MKFFCLLACWRQWCVPIQNALKIIFFIKSWMVGSFYFCAISKCAWDNVKEFFRNGFQLNKGRTGIIFMGEKPVVRARMATQLTFDGLMWWHQANEPISLRWLNKKKNIPIMHSCYDIGKNIGRSIWKWYLVLDVKWTYSWANKPHSIFANIIPKHTIKMFYYSETSEDM